MHAAENNELRLWSCGLLGELERIPGDIGELNDLVTLIVMSQDEEPVAECLLGCQGTRDKIGVGRRGEIPGALDPSFAIRICLLTEQEQGQRGLLRFDERACHGKSLPNRARPQAGRLAPRRGSCNSGNNPASRAAITPGGARNSFTKKDDYMSDVMDTETADGIVLTAEAASKVKTLLEAEGRDDLTLRIAVQPGAVRALLPTSSTTATSMETS